VAYIDTLNGFSAKRFYDMFVARILGGDETKLQVVTDDEGLIFAGQNHEAV
jgi:hypothetical protein